MTKQYRVGDDILVKGIVNSEVSNGGIHVLHDDIDAFYTLDQIYEPEKPVIPQFVAEWIEECKPYGLLHALDYEETEIIIDEWLEENADTFARAWLDGYEVEKEKLYTVEIAEAILTKITRGSNVQYKMLPFGDVSDVFDKAIYTTRLTEQEIKQKDERLWQFAKPVPKEVE